MKYIMCEIHIMYFIITFIGIECKLYSSLVFTIYGQPDVGRTM